MRMTPEYSNMWSTSKTGPSAPGPLDMGMLDIFLDPHNDVLVSLDMFIEDISVPHVENNTDETFDRSGQLPQLDENDIYNNIGDLDEWIVLGDTGFNISTNQDVVYNLNPVLMGEEVPFLELNDLSTPLRCPSQTAELDWIWTDSEHTAHTRDMNFGLDGYYSGGANVCSAEKVSRLNEYSALIGPHMGNNSEELWKGSVNFHIYDEFCYWLHVLVAAQDLFALQYFTRFSFVGIELMVLNSFISKFNLLFWLGWHINLVQLNLLARLILLLRSGRLVWILASSLD